MLRKAPLLIYYLLIFYLLADSRETCDAARSQRDRYMLRKGPQNRVHGTGSPGQAHYYLFKEP
jgi:hypothetical protein